MMEEADIIMEGVTDHSEGYPVTLYHNMDGYLVIRATNEGGYNSTEVDLLDLIAWLKNNKPELLE